MPPIFWTQKQDIGPGPRFGHRMAFDEARQRVVLFGGEPGGPPRDDTWSWDGALWTQVADTGPSGRRDHVMAYDAARQRVVLFGGRAGAALYGDTWAWDGTEWTQVADTGPAPRERAAGAYDVIRQRLVLFGGDIGGGLVHDTWEWDGTEWTQVQDVGPSERQGHVMALLADPQIPSRVVLFGGAAPAGGGLNDTWSWDGNAWVQAADTGPEPRALSAACGHGTVLLFGGVNSMDPQLPLANRVVYGDTWEWSGASWTKVQDIGPAPRWGHAVAYRSGAGRIVSFGGSSVYGSIQEVVPALRSDTWEVPAPAAAPPIGGGVAVEVASVTISPDMIPAAGTTGMQLGVGVALTGPAPTNITLTAAVLVDDGSGSYQVAQPQGFDVPSPIMVQAGAAGTQFAIIRNADPLAPGSYALGVLVEGGQIAQAAFFTLT